MSRDGSDGAEMGHIGAPTTTRMAGCGRTAAGLTRVREREGEASEISPSWGQYSRDCTLVPCLPGIPGMPLSPWRKKQEW